MIKIYNCLRAIYYTSCCTFVVRAVWICFLLAGCQAGDAKVRAEMSVFPSSRAADATWECELLSKRRGLVSYFLESHGIVAGVMVERLDGGALVAIGVLEDKNGQHYLIASWDSSDLVDDGKIAHNLIVKPLFNERTIRWAVEIMNSLWSANMESCAEIPLGDVSVDEYRFVFVTTFSSAQPQPHSIAFDSTLYADSDCVFVKRTYELLEMVERALH